MIFLFCILKRASHPPAEILDDIAIDVPKTFNLMAIIMKGAGLDKDEDG